MVRAMLCLVAVACGGSGATDPTDPTLGDAWMGDWVAVSENGAPAEGTLTLEASAFAQTTDFGSGSCTWTGSVVDADEVTLTLETETGTGGAPCEQAIGVSATPSWTVTDGDDRRGSDVDPRLS